MNETKEQIEKMREAGIPLEGWSAHANFFFVPFSWLRLVMILTNSFFCLK